MSIAARNILGFAEGGTPAPAYWGLCFTAEEPNVVVNMTKKGSSGVLPTVSLETSYDGASWTTFDASGFTTPITLANVGDKVYFRAGSGGNNKMTDDEESYRAFVITGGRCAASGNIMSLIDGDDSTIVTIPATCCFYGLFSGCDLLTTPPLLPATTLKNDCYGYMFRGCSLLATAPELPATTLKNYCYEYMFRQCTSLISTPILPATSPSGEGYCRMFYGCSSLNEVTVMLESWSDCTVGWMYGVAASGTFKCPAALGTGASIKRGVRYCPDNWTVVNI